MMRRMLIFILALTAPAIESLPARAQNARQGALYTRPAKVRLEGLIRRRFPGFYGKAFPQEELIIEEFFPIGWSKDGKFAYYVEPPDEACGCYFGQLYILDLKSDKVLWKFDYNGLDRGDEGKKGEPKSINDIWRKNRKLFSDKLREHNIVPQGRFAFLQFPLNYKGDQLRPEMVIRENTDAETRAYGIVRQATLELTSKRNGNKTVFDKTYNKESDPFPLDMKVVGYLKSPFEPRIAVMLVEVYRGYEGPPHTTSVTMVGSSLDSGYK